MRDSRTQEARALLSDLVRVVHTTLPQVEAHFVRELQMTMVELDMLAVLASAPGGQLSMSLLGHGLTISTASVTRIATQLDLGGHLQASTPPTTAGWSLPSSHHPDVTSFDARAQSPRRHSRKQLDATTLWTKCAIYVVSWLGCSHPQPTHRDVNQ